MKNIAETMDSVSGTVFLYCSPKDEKSMTAFTRVAELTGRRVFSREECQTLDPAVLAVSCGKKAIFVSSSMMDFLDRYLIACPAGQRHLLLCAPRYGEVPNLSRIFHDFWEEREVGIEVLSVLGEESC